MTRSLVEGVKYFLRTFWISSIAITVLTLSIGLIALAFNSRQIVTAAIKQLDKKATIQVLMQDEANAYDLKQAENAIKSLPGVSGVTFVNKEEEKSKFTQTNQTASNFDAIFNTLGYNPFLNSFVVTPDSAESYKTVVESLTNINFTKAHKVHSVVAKQDIIDNLTNLQNITNIVGWAFILFFGFISFVVIINILRISISYFQTEIEIQRLVGATNQYIQGPFIVQGFLFAFIASIIVGGVQIALIQTTINRFGSWLGITGDGLRNELFLSLAIILAGSILLSTLSAWYSTTKYLKK